jgi:peptidoglycan/LPS O-acetylase OafA/YrhL
VLYHTGLPGVPGGFIGVDVFFVISGYLICGMIDAEIRGGEFSLANFYKRRILRIFPALFAMLLVTSLLAYLYFLPVELEKFLASLASAVASVSNIYFASNLGYFDAPATTKPLLHTWSLGVEEQFYVFAPLLMLAAYRFFPRRIQRILAAAAVASLACGVLVYCRNADFAFYLTPCRAWELALGALLAIGFFPVPMTPLRKDALGWLGLLLVLAAVFLGSSSTPLPIMMISASAGAAMIIASSFNSPSATGRLLSARPAVFIGLISYSLYLWHWPILVFQHSDSFLLPRDYGTGGKVALVAIALMVAYLSWKFIETPFRKATRPAPKYAVFAGAAAAMASLAMVAWFGTMLNGIPGRFSDRVVSIGSYLGYDASAAFRTGRCDIAGNRQTFDVQDCLRLDPVRPNYLLMGDSHAAHLWLGLSQAMPDINLMQASGSTCRPVIPARSLFDITFCPRMMRFLFDDFLVKHKIDRVLLSASWKDEDIPALAHTLDVLEARGLDVVVLGPIVEYDRALPRLLADQIRYRIPALADSMRTPGIADRDRRMAELVASKGARYISVYKAVCPHGDCIEFAKGDIPLQFDAGHLTAEGSKKVAHLLLKYGIGSGIASHGSSSQALSAQPRQTPM